MWKVNKAEKKTNIRMWLYVHINLKVVLYSSKFKLGKSNCTFVLFLTFTVKSSTMYIYHTPILST